MTPELEHFGVMLYCLEFELTCSSKKLNSLSICLVCSQAVELFLLLCYLQPLKQLLFPIPCHQSQVLPTM